jgi:hypothetical protein
MLASRILLGYIVDSMCNVVDINRRHTLWHGQTRLASTNAKRNSNSRATYCHTDSTVQSTVNMMFLSHHHHLVFVKTTVCKHTGLYFTAQENEKLH